MYTKKIKILITVGIVLFGALIALVYMYKTANVSPVPSSALVFDGKKIAVELATSSVAWERGLSGRSELKPDTGLLFIFNRPDLWGIWMKDMHFSIDIVWLDVTRKVIKIEENVAPESYPKVYEPTSPARYVLEVPAGTVQKHGIKVGDRAQLRQEK